MSDHFEDALLDERLSAYVDDELDAAERAEIDDLVAADPAYRNALAALVDTKALVVGLPRVVPPAGSVVAQSDESPVEHTPENELAPVVDLASRRRATLKRVIGGAVAAAAVVAVFFAFAGSRVSQVQVVPDVDALARQHTGHDSALGFEPMTSDEVDTMAPVDLGSGMAKDQVFQRDEVVHVRYSDGSHAISVFHQPGSLDWDALPGTGEMMEMGDDPAWHGVMNGVDLFVLEHDDQVITIVADPGMTTMAQKVPSMLMRV